MKISAKVREQAAMICAIAASNEWSDFPDLPGGGMPAHRDASPAHALAWDANAVARKAWLKVSWPEWEPEAPWAEAEALLRTGWTP